jgi:NADH-quinone oxidoreductase subunit C
MADKAARTKLVEGVQKHFGDRVTEVDLDTLDPFMRVEAKDWPDVALFLRDRCGLDYLACLTSVDRGKAEGLEAIYHVERLDAERLGIAVRIRVPREDAHIPTVEHIWRTADWHEREAWDLMGIVFDGHHNLVRILCAEDWEGHPLRKDYKSPDYYHGIKNNVV